MALFRFAWLLAALCTAHAYFPTIVRSGSVKLLERFGKYKRTLEPGLHWTIPLVDSCRTISTREIVLDTPPQNCISADNAPLEVDAVLYCAPIDRAPLARASFLAFYVNAALAVRRHHLRPAALRVRRAQFANRHLEPRAHADPLRDRQADARQNL